MESQSKSKNVIHVTTNSWDTDILKSDLPVFVDFWAEWCGPCRMVGPAVEQLSQTMSDKIKVAKLNVDENQEIAMRYGCTFFILFSNIIQGLERKSQEQ